MEPVITELLPSGNLFVQMMKLLYCVNLIYSYRVNIVPTFNMLEKYVLGLKDTCKDDEVEEDADVVREESTATFWKVNALRSCVIILTIVVVLLVAKALDKFYAVSGAVLGMTNVVLFPAICH